MLVTLRSPRQGPQGARRGAEHPFTSVTYDLHSCKALILLCLFALRLHCDHPSCVPVRAQFHETALRIACLEYLSRSVCVGRQGFSRLGSVQRAKGPLPKLEQLSAALWDQTRFEWLCNPFRCLSISYTNSLLP